MKNLLIMLSNQISLLLVERVEERRGCWSYRNRNPEVNVVNSYYFEEARKINGRAIFQTNESCYPIASNS